MKIVTYHFSILICLCDPRDNFAMGLNGFVFYGEANTTTGEYVSSPRVDVGMTSSGSTMPPQAIFILAFLMLLSWKDIWAGLVGLLEFIITRVHEMSFIFGETWSADEKNENPFTPIDKACTLDGGTKKTEAGESSRNGEEYQQEYILLENANHGDYANV